MSPRIGMAVVLLISLGVAGFFVGRELVPDSGTEADQEDVVERLDGLKTAEAGQHAEARFAGDLLGIYIAPSLEDVPLEVREENEVARAGGCAAIDPDDAGMLRLNDALAMPQAYRLAKPDVEGSNPWASACGGDPFLLGWRYTTSGAQDVPATVTIVRSVFGYDTQDVAVSQVSVETLGGHDAIVIRPVSPDGLGQRTIVYLPEEFGHTAIHAFNLPEAQVLDVASAVAEAAR